MIPLSIPCLKGNEWKYIKECLDTNWVSSAGKYVDKFEEKFAEFLNCNKAVVTMNGTAALQLALETLNIGEGDEVIVSSMTFISPVNTIRYVGAVPVFADVKRDNFVMDADKVEELITERTKAILPVHIYGYPVDMDKIMDLAKKYNLYVIEDATESLGTTYKGRMTGTIGDIGCFSFNGNKLITTGAGGMLVSNNYDFSKRAKYLSTQTKTILDNGSFVHDEVGYNFRMPNLLAAVGFAQLEQIEDFLSAKRRNADLYNKLLKEIDGITVVKHDDKYVNNSYWLYSILVEDEYPLSRDELVNLLKSNDIDCRSFFMPVHRMKPFKECKTGNMAVTEEVSKRGINLPSSVSLKAHEIRYICSCIRSAGNRVMNL